MCMVLNLIDKHIEQGNLKGIRHQACQDSLPRIVNLIQQMAEDHQFDAIIELMEDQPQQCPWPDEIMGYLWEAVIRTGRMPPHYLSSPEETLNQATNSGLAPDAHYLAAIHRYSNQASQRNKIRQWSKQWPDREPLWTALYALTRKASTGTLFLQLWDELVPLIRDGQLSDPLMKVCISHLITKAFLVRDYFRASLALQYASDYGLLPESSAFVLDHLTRAANPEDASDMPPTTEIQPDDHFFRQCICLWGEYNQIKLLFGLNILARTLSRGHVCLQTKNTLLDLYPSDPVIEGTIRAQLPTHAIGHLLLEMARVVLGEDHLFFPQAQAIALTLGTPLHEVCAENQIKGDCIKSLLSFSEPQNWIHRVCVINSLEAQDWRLLSRAMTLMLEAVRHETKQGLQYGSSLIGDHDFNGQFPVLNQNRAYLINTINKWMTEDSINYDEAESLVKEFLFILETPEASEDSSSDQRLRQLLNTIGQWTELSPENTWLRAMLALRDEGRPHVEATDLIDAFLYPNINTRWTLQYLRETRGIHYARALLNTWIETVRPEGVTEQAYECLEELDDDIEISALGDDFADHITGFSAQPKNPTPLEHLPDHLLFRCAALFYHCTAPGEQGYLPVEQGGGTISHKPDWLKNTYREGMDHGVFSIDPYSPESVIEESEDGLIIHLNHMIPFPLEPSILDRSAHSVNHRFRTLLRARAMPDGEDHRVRFWESFMIQELLGYWHQRMIAHDLYTNVGPNLISTLQSMVKSFSLNQIFGVIFNVVNRAAGLKHEHGWDASYTRNVAVSMLGKDYERAINESWTLKHIPRTLTQTIPTSIQFGINQILDLNQDIYENCIPSQSKLPDANVELVTIAP